MLSVVGGAAVTEAVTASAPFPGYESQNYSMTKPSHLAQLQLLHVQKAFLPVEAPQWLDRQ